MTLSEAVNLASNCMSNATEGQKNKSNVTKAANFAQGKGKIEKKEKNVECYYCHKKGHIATFCPKKKCDSEQQNNVNARVSDKSQENECLETSNVSFSFAQQKTISRDWLLLDNQSSVHIFCNKNLLEDVHETMDKLVLMTNG